MSEADPVRRTKDAARRAAGPVPVDTQRRWHFDALRQDLKLGEFAYVPPPEPSHLLFKAMMLVAVVFGGTYVVLLAQTGIVQWSPADTLHPKVETPRGFPVFVPSPITVLEEQRNVPPNLVEPTLPLAPLPPEADSSDDAVIDDGPLTEG